MLNRRDLPRNLQRIHVYFAAPCTHSFQFYFQRCGGGMGVAPWCAFWNPRLFCWHRYPENPEKHKMKPRWAGEKYNLATHQDPIENQISHLCLHLLQRANFIWSQPASAVKHIGIQYVSLPTPWQLAFAPPLSLKVPPKVHSDSHSKQTAALAKKTFLELLCLHPVARTIIFLW